MKLVPLILASSLILSGCGGGGGGGGSSGNAPVPTPPDTGSGNNAVSIAVTDAVPAASTASADPAHKAHRMAHPGFSDLTLSHMSNCDNLAVTTVRRSLVDMSSPEFDEVLDHRLRCDLEAMTSYTISSTGTRDNNDAFEISHGFSTGNANPTGIVVEETIDIPRSTVDDMFTGYLEEGLSGELDLSGLAGNLIEDILLELAEANWSNLVDPDALFDVRATRVSYLSRLPDGSASNALTGLVAVPVLETAADFTPRERILVLTHATGSTPSDLDSGDAWFILASQFASRGYLVIAPDNYGRGGTRAEPETYLMGYRTAQNAMDLLEQVLAAPEYESYYTALDLTIIGYSQGGHSAIGLWELLETQGPDTIDVREVYSGGAPHNLYQTFRGVLKHLDGSCGDDPYCQFVDSDTTVPFATDRILPGFLAYTDTGLLLNDIVSNDTITPEFVSGFLTNEVAYDQLKLQLQLSSFTNISSIGDASFESNAMLHLYHSEFDRLVPAQNTQDLASQLPAGVMVGLHGSRCNGDGYELIFDLVDKVGVLHTLCGLSVLDDVMDDLR